jgi:hypothetical protein
MERISQSSKSMSTAGSEKSERHRRLRDQLPLLEDLALCGGQSPSALEQTASSDENSGRGTPQQLELHRRGDDAGSDRRSRAHFRERCENGEVDCARRDEMLVSGSKLDGQRVRSWLEPESGIESSTHLAGFRWGAP